MLPTTEPPVVGLARTARRHGAVAFDLRRKWARNGWFLRLRINGRTAAYDVMLAAMHHGFVCATPCHEVGDSFQVCVTIPDRDATVLRHWLAAGEPAVLPNGPRALPS
jgi:hypothetical protein